MKKVTLFLLKCILAISPLILLASLLVLDARLVAQQYYGRPYQVAVPDFKLIDNAGHSFNKESLTGSYNYLFFGFTRCTTICPRTVSRLHALSRIVDQNNVNLIFITINPEYDNGEPLDDYQDAFSGKILTLSGERENIWHLARALGNHLAVDYTLPDEPFSHEGKIYLLDPTNRVRLVYGEQHEDVASIARDLQILEREDRKNDMGRTHF